MDRTIRPILHPILAVLVLLVACADGDPDQGPSGPGGGDTVVPRGPRVLALDVKEGPGYPYLIALGDALAAGVQDVKQSFDWDVTAASFDQAGDFVSITDLVFAQVDCRVTLVLRPIDTVRHTYPAAVQGDLDNAAALAAFAVFIDDIHDRTAQIRAQDKLGAILIGNEIDGYLGTDVTRWEQFGNFLAAARLHVLGKDWGSEPPLVSTILMAGGARDATIRGLYETHALPHCDEVAINYYAMGAGFQMLAPDHVGDDLAELAALFPQHTIRLQECGMSSGEACGSSEQRQAEFVTAVFEAWDALSDRIGHVDFAWQTDVDDATAMQWVSDYGMAGSPAEAAFFAYLRTLGLRHHDGTPKPAWNRLVQEAAARGW
jgi:hypothetical protein